MVTPWTPDELEEYYRSFDAPDPRPDPHLWPPPPWIVFVGAVALFLAGVLCGAQWVLWGLDL